MVKCEICGDEYNRYENLKKHVENNHNDQLLSIYPEVCNICGDHFKNIDRLLIHVEKYHKDINVEDYYNKYIFGKLKCRHCNKDLSYNERFATYYCSKEHLKLYNNGKLQKDGIVCKICNMSVENWLGFSTHLRAHKIKPKDYYDKYMKKEGEGNCVTCGNETRWISLSQGYLSHCGNKCSANSEIVRNKAKETTLEKYGVDNISRSEENKEKKRKIFMEKLGVDHPLKHQHYKDKLLNTREKRYGSKSYHNIDKMKETLLERYGVDNPSKVEEFKNKQQEAKRYISIEKLESYGYKIISYDKMDWELECKEGHKFHIDTKLIYTRLKYGVELCSICNPVDTHISFSEEELFNFIDENTDYEVERVNNKLIKPQELDIYIPALQLAFEYNGLYWHSDKYKNKKYHENKSQRCIDKGINLFHVFENDWKNKKPIIKSMILNLLGKSERIFARKCEVKEVKGKIIKDFLNENHLQGFVQSKVNLGLYYYDELISIMSFDRSKFNKKYQWELSRFCNKLNTSVIGGASKLLKYFIEVYNPKNIVSYSDKSWSTGNLYERLGFDKIKQSKASYYYVDKITLEKHHRFNFRKDKLKEMGYDISKTEEEIMFTMNKYFKIWDCGKDVWLLNFE